MTQHDPITFFLSHPQSLLGQRAVNRDTGAVVEPAALSIEKGSQLYVRKGRAMFTFEATPELHQISPSSSFSSDLNPSTPDPDTSGSKSGRKSEGLPPGQKSDDDELPLVFHPRLLCIKAIEIVTSRWDPDKCSVTLRAKIVTNPAAPEAVAAAAAATAAATTATTTTSIGVAAGAEEEVADASEEVGDVGTSDVGGGWTDLGPSRFSFVYSLTDHKVVGALSRPKTGKMATGRTATAPVLGPPSVGTRKSDQGKNDYDDCASVLCSAFQLVFDVEDYNIGLHQVVHVFF